MPRPHISAALQHLRFSITAAAMALALALSAQIVVWSLVHFTEVRTAELTEEAYQGPLKVVRPPAVITRKDPVAAEKPGIKIAPAGTATASTEPAANAGADLAKAAEATDGKPAKSALGAAPRPEPAPVNEVPSSGDVMLKRATIVVQSFGVISAFLLLGLMFQGVVVAAGAAVPGVEKAVTAGTWSMLICVLCLPLRSILPDVPFTGVFQSYDWIVHESIVYRSGTIGAPGPIGFFGAHLGIPGVLLIGLIMVVMRFRSGIEAGVIVTSVSQLDEKLEREIRAMKLGQLATPRAVGALHSAIGDTPVLSAHLTPAAGAESLTAAAAAVPRGMTSAPDPGLRLRPPASGGGSGRAAPERPILDPSLNDSNRRPI